jgi:hypothetical protein
MEEMKCHQCGQTLSVLHWSNGKGISLCNNGRCPAYRNPVSQPSNGDHLENQTLEESFEEQIGTYAPLRRKTNVSQRR